MVINNTWLFILGNFFQVLVFTISVFTIWGIVRLIVFNKKIERIKKKYFDQLVNNVIVVRIEYFRLMEDINFLNKFKESLPRLVKISAEKAMDDYEELKTIIFKKRKTINKFKLSLIMLALLALFAFLGFLLKDFLFYGDSYCIFLLIDMSLSIVGLFFIKFVL